MCVCVVCRVCAWHSVCACGVMCVCMVRYLYLWCGKWGEWDAKPGTASPCVVAWGPPWTHSAKEELIRNSGMLQPPQRPARNRPVWLQEQTDVGQAPARQTFLSSLPAGLGITQPGMKHAGFAWNKGPERINSPAICSICTST